MSKPYVVCITETTTKYVVVYAEGPGSAVNATQELCASGIIDTSKNVASAECICTPVGVAAPETLVNYANETYYDTQEEEVP